MLKFLVSRSRIEGTASVLQSTHEKAVEAVSRQTLGNLVKAFLNAAYSSQACEGESSMDVDEVWFSASFKIDASPVEAAQRREALERIVEERNKLIHQTLSKFDQTSVESCRKLAMALDQQNERIVPEYESLRALVIAVKDGYLRTLDALESSVDLGTTSINSRHH